MRNILILGFIFFSCFTYGQDSFKLFCEKEVEELNKTFQVIRIIPDGYEIYSNPFEPGYFLKKVGAQDNTENEPLYPILRIIDEEKSETVEITIRNNGYDTDYYFPKNYLIGENRYLVIKRRFSSVLIDIESNEIIPNFRTKKRENVEIEDAQDLNLGDLYFFDKNYLMYRQGVLGVFCIDYKNKNNPKELNSYHFGSRYRAPFFFIDSLGENRYRGIISLGDIDNTSYLFKGIKLKQENGKVKSQLKAEKYLVLQKDNNEYLIVDLEQGILLNEQSDKETIDKIIIK
ncbi:MAG: hypothetical protein GQ564_12390 [Bacteroidales bacterium]|nr:hypothetical protein [Bacteroidales bacterium]